MRVTVGRKPVSYFELEVELKGDGSEADLAALAAELAGGGACRSSGEPRAGAGAGRCSRGRGWAAAFNGRTRRARTQAAGAELLARRAQVVLLWAGGLPTGEIALRTGLSVGRVRFWLASFARSGSAFFTARPTSLPAGRRTNGSPEPRPQSRSCRFDRAAHHHGVCRAYGVDLRRARFVASQALAIFGALKPTHRLPKKRRKQLRQATLLCNIGATIDPEHPHAAGRDLILAQPLRDISTTERLALACIVAFQRDKVKPSASRPWPPWRKSCKRKFWRWRRCCKWPRRWISRVRRHRRGSGGERRRAARRADRSRAEGGNDARQAAARARHGTSS